MIKQLRVGKLILLLLVGEIVTVSLVILAGMNTEEVIYMMIGFIGVWVIYVFVSVLVGRIEQGG